jgi:hypothetical protein
MGSLGTSDVTSDLSHVQLAAAIKSAFFVNGNEFRMWQGLL